MKRISDFEGCQMDMKQMAAMNGGHASSGTDAMATYNNCGDTAYSDWVDDVRWFNGQSYTDYTCTGTRIVDAPCMFVIKPTLSINFTNPKAGSNIPNMVSANSLIA